MILYRIEEPNV